MAHVTIQPDKCKACLLCIEFCPRACLALSDTLNRRGFHPASCVAPERCTGCRICALMCPDVCITVWRTPPPAP